MEKMDKVVGFYHRDEPIQIPLFRYPETESETGLKRVRRLASRYL